MKVRWSAMMAMARLGESQALPEMKQDTLERREYLTAMRQLAGMAGVEESICSVT